MYEAVNAVGSLVLLSEASRSNFEEDNMAQDVACTATNALHVPD